ncbi:MAG: phosphoenolpyruvate--protein phosphotransferase [Pyrinomonadaceae bacterium]
MTETKQVTHSTPAKPEQRLPALAVSRGIGIGRIKFFQGERRRFFRLNLSAEQIEDELGRFKSALNKSILQLRELSSNGEASSGQPVSDIFGVHLLMLESSLVKKIEAVISAQRVNTEWAIRTVLDEYAQKQESVSDTQFKDKSLDIEDVANRLIAALTNAASATEMSADSVIVARDLTPSMILELVASTPAALITEQGGWTSHSSILAREFNLPMVSGVRDLEHRASMNDLVIVNGFNGEVILNPDDKTLLEFRTLNGLAKVKGADFQLSNNIATLDGTEIVVRANVDQPAAYATARENGAQGIGLYRSESLMRQPGSVPSEDEQVAAYRQIADAVGEDGVNIRTFDVVGDQFAGNSRVERNPSLGLRSIRLSLTELTHFRTQVRALLRASLDRKIDLILPMASGLGEILLAKEVIDEERQKLTENGLEIGTPKIGAMIETPSSVITANEIAKNVDFLCIGTNDLVQYLLAVDRDNDAVADWYQTLHPAVIKAIGDVLSASLDAGIRVIVCGEMAGSPFYVPVLIGLGARELSMNVNSIQPVRQLLSGISVNDTIALVEKIKTFHTADEIETCLREHYLKNWKDLFPTGLLNVRHR